MVKRYGLKDTHTSHYMSDDTTVENASDVTTLEVRNKNYDLP